MIIKSKEMVLGEEEGLICEISLGKKQLEPVLEFEVLRFLVPESHIDGTECRKVALGGKLQVQSNSLVYPRNLSLKCTRVLHMGLLVFVLLYMRRRKVFKLCMYRRTILGVFVGYNVKCTDYSFMNENWGIFKE